MAEAAPILTLEPTNVHSSIQIPIFNPTDPVLAGNDVIPTIDYLMLFSDDPLQRSRALDPLAHACEEYGFFHLVNHGVPNKVIEDALKATGDYFDETPEEEKKRYEKRNPTDTFVWGRNSHPGENREYLKFLADPLPHLPTKPLAFREAAAEYFRRFRDVKFGLARAMSKNLGYEESYIEKVFKLESGCDICSMNVYPPSSQSKGSTGLAPHTDPGFIVSLVDDMGCGLQVLSHKGNWVNVCSPRNSFLIQVGDHLEILTNGKYKSHVHHVVLKENTVRRTSIAAFHSPSLETYVSPAPEFVDESHPSAYGGMTFKESLEANGHDVIDASSSIEQIRLRRA